MCLLMLSLEVMMSIGPHLPSAFAAGVANVACERERRGGNSLVFISGELVYLDLDLKFGSGC